VYCFCIFSNKIDLRQETSFYYNPIKTKKDVIQGAGRLGKNGIICGAG
jgi:hypothetical protein